MPAFVVDTNFFIQAHRMYYPLDVALSFWTQVESLADSGNIVSIDKVRNEIFKNEDSLTEWCKDKLPSNFFKDSSETMNEYIQVANWANSMSSHYKTAALEEFLDADEADAWLVAYALRNNCSITTYEVTSGSKSKVKIPEACNALGVSFVNPIDMLRTLGVSF